MRLATCLLFIPVFTLLISTLSRGIPCELVPYLLSLCGDITEQPEVINNKKVIKCIIFNKSVDFDSC